MSRWVKHGPSMVMVSGDGSIGTTKNLVLPNRAISNIGPARACEKESITSDGPRQYDLGQLHQFDSPFPSPSE
jgi:hypothetical protein